MKKKVFVILLYSLFYDQSNANFYFIKNGSKNKTLEIETHYVSGLRGKTKKGKIVESVFPSTKSREVFNKLSKNNWFKKILEKNKNKIIQQKKRLSRQEKMEQILNKGRYGSRSNDYITKYIQAINSGSLTIRFKLKPKEHIKIPILMREASSTILFTGFSFVKKNRKNSRFFYLDPWKRNSNCALINNDRMQPKQVSYSKLYFNNQSGSNQKIALKYTDMETGKNINKEFTLPNKKNQEINLGGKLNLINSIEAIDPQWNQPICKIHPEDFGLENKNKITLESKNNFIITYSIS